ncbi:MAG: TM2 domain-containing protein [Gemmatimonadaceae bacterium]
MAQQSPITATMPCRACDAEISAIARECPHCGAQQFDAKGSVAATAPSERRALTAGLLCFFIGVFGAHRFYVGKYGTGILQLLTLGGLGIWWLADLIMILTGQFRDADGRRVTGS